MIITSLINNNIKPHCSTRSNKYVLIYILMYYSQLLRINQNKRYTQIKINSYRYSFPLNLVIYLFKRINLPRINEQNNAIVKTSFRTTILDTPASSPTKKPALSGSCEQNRRTIIRIRSRRRIFGTIAYRRSAFIGVRWRPERPLTKRR